MSHGERSYAGAVAELSERDFQARYGRWSPWTPAQAAAQLAGFTGQWWVVGGWAIEAFTGRSRPHEDIDIVVLRRDLAELRSHLDRRFHLWANEGGTFRFLDPADADEQCPSGSFQVWLREDACSPWLADFLVGPGEPGTWVNRRMPSMVLAVEEATWVAPDGVRYQNPEGVLLFKAAHARAKDERDFEEALPLLSRGRRRWLRAALVQAHPGHGWIDRLR